MRSAIPYFCAFALALVLTLVLTPFVREANRRLGMVDKPDARRINKVPIPRGGGLALFLGVAGASLAMWAFSAFQFPSLAAYGKLLLLSFGIVALGLADDKVSLPPRVKLVGQVAIAVLTWAWAGLGFRDLWPALPAWLDCIVTVFWIVGAVNAFNLIDGLDGLASGLALIATVGMAGALIFTGRPSATIFHFAFAGGLLGFLRYNYNPASVFLGDCGSMFIGFVLSSLALLSHDPNSYLVSLGVPLLAMGVPIFDTALAILRRLVRRLLNGTSPGGKVMEADREHLHHRILKSVGLSQRKAAWILYACGFVFVGVGLVGMGLQSRSGGVWLLALTVAMIVIFRDVARVELFDIGRLLELVAHNRRTTNRRRMARLAVPMWLTFDIAALSAIYLLMRALVCPEEGRAMVMKALPIRVMGVFFCLVLFRVYRTVWSRAMLSNYLSLVCACLLGSVIGFVAIYYYPGIRTDWIVPFTFGYASISVSVLVFVRIFRNIVRDAFYEFGRSQVSAVGSVSRILVYGAGLRYRSFRRELVRKAAVGNRIIVGIIDDDLILRGHYIGGIRVLGPLIQAPELIAATKADTVVITCEVSDAWMKIVRQVLEPTGVRIVLFNLAENELHAGNRALLDSAGGGGYISGNRLVERILCRTTEKNRF